MKERVKVLIVDDDRNHCNMLTDLVSDWDYAASGAGSGEEAVAKCQEGPFALVLMDIKMPGMSGIDAMREIKRYNPAIPVLIMTAYSDVPTAVDALKSGAYDYLTKPLDFDELKLALDRVLDHASLREENRTLRNALKETSTPAGFVAQSRPMRRVVELLSTVAPSEATVLITGESGTGKEVIAKLLHHNSNRAAGPFAAINCAAINEALLESELFGHEKGAFTGAEKTRDGKFLAANKGTVFLDEIGEMSLPMQAKLLRVIQEREIQRVGSDRSLKVDVRILAATNRDLRREVDAGRFRQDLYYRLNVVAVALPPLRERIEDIPLLATFFLKRFAAAEGRIVRGFTPEAMDRLLKYPWPGNVRELENTVERAMLLLAGEYIGERELPPGMIGNGERDDEIKGDLDLSEMTLDELEQAAVREAMRATGGNKSAAARRLGVTRKTLKAKLQKMDFEPGT